MDAPWHETKLVQFVTPLPPFLGSLLDCVLPPFKLGGPESLPQALASVSPSISQIVDAEHPQAPKCKHHPGLLDMRISTRSWDVSFQPAQGWLHYICECLTSAQSPSEEVCAGTALEHRVVGAGHP